MSVFFLLNFLGFFGFLSTSNRIEFLLPLPIKNINIVVAVVLLTPTLVIKPRELVLPVQAYCDNLLVTGILWLLFSFLLDNSFIILEAPER